MQIKLWCRVVQQRRKLSLHRLGSYLILGTNLIHRRGQSTYSRTLDDHLGNRMKFQIITRPDIRIQTLSKWRLKFPPLYHLVLILQVYLALWPHHLTRWFQQRAVQPNLTPENIQGKIKNLLRHLPKKENSEQYFLYPKNLNVFWSLRSCRHRWVLPVLRYPSNVVIYHYPPFWVI